MGAAWVALTLLGILWMVPFLWMVSTSFKGIDEVYAFPPRFMPEEIHWSNYLDAWQAVPVLAASSATASSSPRRRRWRWS